MVPAMNDLGISATHLLLLGGSGEARHIAAALAEKNAMRVTASLLYPARVHADLPVPTRFGGFGGDDGFRSFLAEEGIGAVLDATHPFSTRIAARTARICHELSLPHARLLRPEWTPEPGDNWHFARDEAEASTMLLPGQKVFATTGQASLGALVGDSLAEFKVRKLTDRAPSRQYRNVEFVRGQGPFSVEQEIATFKSLSIDVLVAKNSGGAVSRTKLDAARALGLPVILIDRPAQPEAALLPDVAAALDWIDAL